MKKTDQNDKDELRVEYKRSDFPDGLVRGKYAERLRKSSNIVVLKPEVAEAFPNEEAVNNALLSLIELARKTARPTKRSTGLLSTNRNVRFERAKRGCCRTRLRPLVVIPAGAAPDRDPGQEPINIK